MTDTKETNFDYMRENLAFSDAGSQDIFATFLECTREYIAKAKQLLHSENWNDLTRLRHTLKGTAANIGTSQISRLGKDLQAAAEKIFSIKAIYEGLQ